jgi:hypothetical protein
VSSYVEEVVEAIYAEKGLLLHVARRLNIRRTILRQFIDRKTTCLRALVDARESQKDHTEGRLYDAIDDRDMRAIAYYLGSQAKDRGYGDPKNGAGVAGDMPDLVVNSIVIVSVPPDTTYPSELAVVIHADPPIAPPGPTLAIENHSDDDEELPPEPTIVQLKRQLGWK